MTPDLHNAERGGALPPLDVREAFPMRCNVDDERIYANVRHAASLGLPLIKKTEPHSNVAVIVGGGPSLAETLDELRLRYRAGYHIYALNGAAHYLVKNGIVPHGLIMLDARPFNRKFVEGLPRGIHYLIASQCDPSVFEALRGERVTIWHPNLEGKSGVQLTEETVLIGSGTVVGIRSLKVLSAIGYRAFHLFGYDSSYRGDEGHAYEQAENAGEVLEYVTLNGVDYFGAPWMIRQADDFQMVAAELAESGHSIAVHGDGLLPAVAKEMGKRRERAAPSQVLRLNYDRATHPTSYDFVYWLVLAEMYRRQRGFGSLEVYFRDGVRNDGLPGEMEDRERIYRNVMRPCVRMIGAKLAYEPGEDINLSYTGNEIAKAARAGVQVPFFVPDAADVEWAARKYPGRFITVTLREADYWLQRNSNIEAWKTFARECGERVIFVRDTAKAGEPLDGFETCREAAIGISARMALYQRAALNLFVQNGPHALAVFSGVNWLSFNQLIENYRAGTAEWWKYRIGVKPGEQFPWAHEGQRLAWLPDTLENLRSEFRRSIAADSRAA